MTDDDVSLSSRRQFRLSHIQYSLFTQTQTETQTDIYTICTIGLQLYLALIGHLCLVSDVYVTSAFPVSIPSVDLLFSLYSAKSKCVCDVCEHEQLTKLLQS